MGARRRQVVPNTSPPVAGDTAPKRPFALASSDSQLPERIFLVGFMGCGKSTVGPMIAARIGWTFVDLDGLIEARAGLPISEIFLRFGEGHFRRMEYSLLREVADGPTRVVVALGGGAFVSEGNRSLVAHSGVSVWIDVSFRISAKRAVRARETRPLAQSPDQMYRLFKARLPFYHEADERIRVGDVPADRVARSILRLLREDWAVVAERRRLHL